MAHRQPLIHRGPERVEVGARVVAPDGKAGTVTEIDYGAKWIKGVYVKLDPFIGQYAGEEEPETIEAEIRYRIDDLTWLDWK